jgi:fluoride exporter
MFLNTLFAASSPVTASALVAAGGAVGALGRYHMGRLVVHALGNDPARAFPWATLAVNILGCLAIGLLYGWFIREGAANENLRLLLGVGILGGFTTFSTFGLETLTLMQRGALLCAFAYVAASVVVGLAAVFVGMSAVRGAA